jgi:hypothetical protein
VKLSRVKLSRVKLSRVKLSKAKAKMVFHLGLCSTGSSALCLAACCWVLRVKLTGLEPACEPLLPLVPLPVLPVYALKLSATNRAGAAIHVIFMFHSF